MRRDLLLLDDQSLIQMANAGLVKRGRREIEAGQGPILAEAEDGTIEARFPDGTLTRLAPGMQPAQATCTCPASGMCRHRVALVLACQCEAGAGPPEPRAWDPGTLDSAAFEATLSNTVRSEIARLLSAPLTVAVERSTTPVARLPMATVRFPVPDDVGYARCDCSTTTRCAHIAIAIRAFRAAGEEGEVRLGPAGPPGESADLGPAVDIVLRGLLMDGVVAGMAAHGQALDHAGRLARKRGATWLALALDDLAEQVEAYDARSARYDESRVVQLAAELYARTRAQDQASSLGLGEVPETSMAKTRLVSLGVRLRAEGSARIAAAALADTDTGAVMQFEHRFGPDDQGRPPAAETLGKRQMAPGLSVEGLALGQILTSVARRRADGALLLGVGSQGRTVLMPRGLAQDLPPPLRTTDVATLIAGFAGRAPLILQPRRRARDMHVFDVEEVVGHAWSPGSQAWHGAVSLQGDGGMLHLERLYDAAAPHALEALFAAADGRHGPIRQVAGTVRIEDGAAICDPWLIVADRLVVPDIETASGRAFLPAVDGDDGGQTPPLHAWRLLAGTLHAGLKRDRTAFAARAMPLILALEDAGYRTTAAKFSSWINDEAHGIDRFGQACVWLSTLLEGTAPTDG